MDDHDAYYKFPRHRKWFDKLYLSNLLGYYCGPSGTAPSKTGQYITRPIYNLSGMGVGAKVSHVEAGDCSATPPGHFWCEYFQGPQYSATFEFVHATNPYWKMLSCWQGYNLPNNLSRFMEWKRSDHTPEVPRELNSLSEVGIINVEFIGDKVIEVHMRESPDPEYDHVVPAWSTDRDSVGNYWTALGYQFIESYDDANGHLNEPRIGFYVK